jgi:predicted aspartyl protease
MGHVRVRIRIANPNDRDHAVEVQDAPVGTGASFTTIPRRIADQLGLDILGQHEVRSAAGPITVDRSFAFVDIDGRDGVSPIWISDSCPGVLIGVLTLESLALAVDPGAGKLTDSELLLL